MSPNAYRCQPVTDSNCVLKEKITALVQRHRRHGAVKIYLKLRQASKVVNHQRVDCLYAKDSPQVKKRERNPLEHQTAANQVWSMRSVFDRTAEGRRIKMLDRD